MNPSRRLFLQTSMMIGASQCLRRSVLAAAPRLSLTASLEGALTDSPIQKVASAFSPDFNGDDINRPHDILWNKDDYLKSRGGRPAVIEQCQVAVLGGGMSGLLSAYYLKQNDVMVFEQAPQFGGNSKGEDFNGSCYSIGAAYINVPAAGSRVEKLLEDLNLRKSFRLEGETNILWKDKITEEFWRGQFDAKKAKAIAKFHALLKDINKNHYPDVPHDSESSLSREELNALDKMTFQQWLQQNFPELTEEVVEYCQLYAWSSFGGSIDEISAAQMLNFLAAEAGGIMALPGGNAAIACGLQERLKKRFGPDRLRAGCFVIDVALEENGSGVIIVYENAKRELKALRAEKCIIAAPKFVAKYLVGELPEDQRRAMDDVRYRGYVVANVILKKKISSPGLELYWLQGKVPESPLAMTPPDRPFTDICFGTWAQAENVEQSVLTIYKALPMDGARQFLFHPAAWAKNKKSIEEGLGTLLNSLGLKAEDVSGMRLTRWGHSMPLAEQGFVAEGKPEILSRSIQNRIYFANQDNWANPAFETAEAVAFSIAGQI